MKAMLRFAACIAAFLAVSVAAFAQASPPDYEEWGRVVLRAEEAIDNNRASEAAMDELRNQLEGWRSLFIDEKSKRRVSVATVEAQLDSLGPVPETGEPEDVATERDLLDKQLAFARAPARRAELAEAQATELVRAIDTLMRDRQALLLIEPGPVPINPAIWAEAWRDVERSLLHVALEFSTGWVHEKNSDDFGKYLPVILFYLGIGLILIARGGRWVRMGLQRLLENREEVSAARWVMLFILSFGQVVLPMLGVLALTRSVYATDLAGLRGDIILSNLPLLTFQILVARWLGERIFSRFEEPLLLVKLTPAEKVQGRHAASALGVSIAANTLFSELARYDNWQPEAQAVVFFTITLFAAVCMAALSQLISKHGHKMTVPEENQRTATGMVVVFLARFMLATAIVSVVVGAFGLTRAGAFLAFATTKTVLLVGFLLVLQRLVQKIFAALEGRNDDEASLPAVLTGVFMIVLSLPVLALFWGARVADLHELWGRLAAGLSVGGMTLSPRTIILFFLVYSVGHMLTRLSQSMLRDNILPKTKLDPGGQNAIVVGAGYVGIFLAALIALNVAGIDLSNVALFAGALSVGIGFGLQTIVSNFVSGIILLIERPISEGDWIEVGGEMGYVRDISVRATRIETFDRTDVVVPNSDFISGTVTNYTRGNTVGRIVVPVGVAYGTDTRRVEAILREIAEAHPMVLANPAPGIVFQGFGADSLDFEIRAILRDVNWSLSVRSEINHEIARRFVEENIEIPFAQRDIWLRNPEALRGEPPLKEPPVEMVQAQPAQSPLEPDLQDMPGEGDGDGDGR
ncbi:Small-conductance mechanosensitive channel [Shimia haliotis]|uniref:Small-conductance mechanosensitive channel n=2 Tax=Shimia haliotis TaxID=1280847 RepID=A0A1I4AVH0_9RHOB|nr:Small-conductance mechanosensitive channel [Shimia haliotis]